MADGELSNYDIIIEELIKRKNEEQNAELKNTVEEHTEQIEQIQIQVDNEISDEDDKNVIDSGKLSPTLSSSEKKRYQNIGKEFIDGAGKEFQNVIKATKFKSMMSTMKEKFAPNVEKLKSAIAKVKKNSGFFEKLLTIIGILGSIAYMFKDKILEVLPQIKDFIKDMYEKAKNFISDGAVNGFEIVKDWARNFLSSMISNLKQITNNVIEKLYGLVNDGIHVFFNETLPQSVYKLYLDVLSLFSDDAADLAEEKELQQKEAEDYAKQIAEQGEEIVKNQNNSLDKIKEAEDAVKKFQLEKENNQNYNDAQIAELKRYFDIANFSNQSELIAILNDLTQDNRDVVEMVKQGQLDVTSLLQGIKDAQGDGMVTREEMFNALKESITNTKIAEELKIKQEHHSTVTNKIKQEHHSTISSNINGNVKVEQVQKSNDSSVVFSENTKKFLDECDGMFNNLISAQQPEPEIKIEQNTSAVDDKETKSTPIITTINATEAITETLQEAFVNLSKAIQKFLSGDTIATNIKIVLEETNAKFQNFFDGILSFTTQVIDNLKNCFNRINEHLYDKEQFINKLQQKLEDDTQEEHLKQESQNQVKTKNDFQINVHVSIPTESNKNKGVQELANDIASIDLELNKLVSSSNDLLQSICDDLKNAKNKMQDTNLDERITQIVDEKLKDNPNTQEIVTAVVQKEIRRIVPTSKSNDKRPNPSLVMQG